MILFRPVPAALAFSLLAAASPAVAGVGDLLVAPTRLVLDGRRGSEIVLNNIGDEPATYRVSVELRRMKSDGTLEDVKDPNPAEKAAADMIIYAPRRVTLAPREPQAIRVTARPPQGLPDGEYRVHLLFRAIPPARPATEAAAEKGRGLQLQLIPVYGVTIPAIVRLGNLDAKAGITNVQVEEKDGKPVVGLDLTRSGTRSTFGEVRILKSGVKEPVGVLRGVAVYTEIGSRHVAVPVSDTFKGTLAGPVTVQYLEPSDNGSSPLAETRAVLR